MANLLPPNDPDRPCWSVLSEVLGRPITPPADPQLARDTLRSLLVEAYTTHPNRLLRLALFSGAAKGSMRGKIQALGMAIKANGIDFTTATPRGRDVDHEMRDVLADPVWRSAIEYILSRWWSMGSGADTVTRSEVYRELGTNTNEPVRSWLPEKSGLVPYLRVRTQHVICEFYKKIAKYQRMVSLDKCLDARMELTSDGQFIRPMSGPGDEYEEMVDLVTRGRTEFAEDLMAEVDAEMEGSAGADRPEGQVDSVLADLRADRSANGDWPLRAFVPEFDVALAGDVSHVRQQALVLLERLRTVDKSIAEDYDAVAAEIQNWNGENSIVAAVPELGFAALEHRYVLAGVQEPKPVKAPPPPKAMEQMDLFGVTVEAIEATPNQPLAHLALAQKQVLLSEVMEFTPDRADLDDPNRLDYLFLAENVGAAPRADLFGPDLHDEIGRLRDQWLAEVEAAGHEEFALALRAWKPGKQTFANVIQAAIPVAPPPSPVAVMAKSQSPSFARTAAEFDLGV